MEYCPTCGTAKKYRLGGLLCPHRKQDWHRQVTQLKHNAKTASPDDRKQMLRSAKTIIKEKTSAIPTA